MVVALAFPGNKLVNNDSRWPKISRNKLLEGTCRRSGFKRRNLAISDIKFTTIQLIKLNIRNFIGECAPPTYWQLILIKVWPSFDLKL